VPTPAPSAPIFVEAPKKVEEEETEEVDVGHVKQVGPGPKEAPSSAPVEYVYVTPSPAAPYSKPHGTGVPAIPVGTAKPSGSVPYKPYKPTEFTGGAGRFGVSMSAIAVMAAGLLLL